MQPSNLKSGDSDDLEALFDSIASQRDEQPVAPSPVDEHLPTQTLMQPGDESLDTNPDHYDVFHRIGNLTRKLHDALHELGYDKSVENAVGSLPDARARLAYIANLTGQAADKVLANVEITQTLQDNINEKAKSLDKKWTSLFNNELSLEEFKTHALETHQFLKDVQKDSQQTNSHLTDIMMAQDFHDLTGQVVNRIAAMAQTLEEQLVQLLLDTTPPEKRTQVDDTWLSGPVIDKGAGRVDICSDQTQVDDLLESLGF